MKHKQWIIYVVSFCLMTFPVVTSFGQSAHQHLRSGDKHYEEQEFSQAEEAYRKALENKRSLKGKYNLGNSLFNQQRYEEAIQQYMDAANIAKGKEEKANAYYNLGNAHLSAQQFKESIEAYKNTLSLNPDDVEAKQNLFVAKQLLQQQQQQQQQNQQDQNQEQQEQEQQQEQQQQEQNQDQNQEQQQQNQQSQEEQQEQEQDYSEEKQDLDKKDAARLLEIVENEEKKVQEKMRRVDSKKPKSKKDW